MNSVQLPPAVMQSGTRFHSTLNISHYKSCFFRPSSSSSSFPCSSSSSFFSKAVWALRSTRSEGHLILCSHKPKERMLLPYGGETKCPVISTSHEIKSSGPTDEIILAFCYKGINSSRCVRFIFGLFQQILYQEATAWPSLLVAGGKMVASLVWDLPSWNLPFIWDER